MSAVARKSFNWRRWRLVVTGGAIVGVILFLAGLYGSIFGLLREGVVVPA